MQLSTFPHLQRCPGPHSKGVCRRSAFSKICRMPWLARTEQQELRQNHGSPFGDYSMSPDVQLCNVVL